MSLIIQRYYNSKYKPKLLKEQTGLLRNILENNAEKSNLKISVQEVYSLSGSQEFLCRFLIVQFCCLWKRFQFF